MKWIFVSIVSLALVGVTICTDLAEETNSTLDTDNVDIDCTHDLDCLHDTDDKEKSDTPTENQSEHYDGHSEIEKYGVKIESSGYSSYDDEEIDNETKKDTANVTGENNSALLSVLDIDLDDGRILMAKPGNLPMEIHIGRTTCNTKIRIDKCVVVVHDLSKNSCKFISVIGKRDKYVIDVSVARDITAQTIHVHVKENDCGIKEQNMGILVIYQKVVDISGLDNGNASGKTHKLIESNGNNTFYVVVATIAVTVVVMGVTFGVCLFVSKKKKGGSYEVKDEDKKTTDKEDDTPAEDAEKSSDV